MVTIRYLRGKSGCSPTIQTGVLIAAILVRYLCLISGQRLSRFWYSTTRKIKMLDLILACAPNVAPSTIQQIIRVESAGNPLEVNINTRNGVKLKPAIKIKTMEDAIAVTYAAISLGHTVDM